MAPDAWIDLLLRRGADLRRAGVLSIGCDGCAATLAPAGPEADVGADKTDAQSEPTEPTNPWENPASYPTGHVPSLDELDEEMPDIPTFGDD